MRNGPAGGLREAFGDKGLGKIAGGLTAAGPGRIGRSEAGASEGDTLQFVVERRREEALQYYG